MSVIYILLTVSVIVGVTFFVIFIIAVRSGQYDDDYTPSVRMLFEDELGSLPYWLCGLLSFIFLPIWLFIDIIGLSIGFIWLIWMKSNDKYLNISGDNYGMEKNSSSHNTS